MSDYDDDDFEDENENGSNLVKDLRKQLRAQKKLLDEATTELSTHRSEKRSANVAKLLKESGADPRYSKFYTSEDASEEAVKAWIESEAELLGVKEPETPDPNADQIERISSAVADAPPDRSTALAAQVEAMRNAKTREEFEAAKAASFRQGADVVSGR